MFLLSRTRLKLVFITFPNIYHISPKKKLFDKNYSSAAGKGFPSGLSHPLDVNILFTLTLQHTMIQFYCRFFFNCKILNARNWRFSYCYLGWKSRRVCNKTASYCLCRKRYHLWRIYSCLIVAQNYPQTKKKNITSDALPEPLFKMTFNSLEKILFLNC